MTDRRPLTLDEPLLDASAVGVLLGVEPDTVLAWANPRKTPAPDTMPCLRLSKRCVRWTRPMLEEWLASRLDNGRP